MRRRQTIDASSENKILWTPLLVGKVQFCHSLNLYIPLYKAELKVCNVYEIKEMKTMNITTLVKAIKNNKHIGWNLIPAKELTDSDKEKFKYFTPQYLIANEWSNKEIECTLETYFPNSDSKSEE